MASACEGSNIPGYRPSWSIWPQTQEEAEARVIPLGCLYTPFEVSDGVFESEHGPILCHNADCSAVLNMHCAIDARGNEWACPFCFARNELPPHYEKKLYDQGPTVEYVCQAPRHGSPTVLFILDRAAHPEELQEACDSIQQALALLPMETVVGFVSFEEEVYLHELAAEETTVQDAHVFSGTKDYTTAQIKEVLESREGLPDDATSSDVARFLLPLGDCEFVFNALLEELAANAPANPPGPVERRKRCTGSALNVALRLLDWASPQNGARIVSLLAGPCTVGPGTVVGRDPNESMRRQKDFSRRSDGSAPNGPAIRYSARASAFYRSLAFWACAKGVALDLFICTMGDEVGLYEMRHLASQTGGNLVLADAFVLSVFKGSFQKLFENGASARWKTCLDARVEVSTSPPVRVSSAISSLSSNRNSTSSALRPPTPVKRGRTFSWASPSLDRDSTVAFFFDLSAPERPESSDPPAWSSSSSSSSLGPSPCAGPRPTTTATTATTGPTATTTTTTTAAPGTYLLQFRTSYIHPSGRRRLRVTTVAHASSGQEQVDVAEGLDPEVGAVLLARLLLSQQDETEEPLKTIQKLDTSLINFLRRAGATQLGEDSDSNYRLEAPAAIGTFAGLLHGLRRSGLLQPDAAELNLDRTTYRRSLFSRAPLASSLVMIRPTMKEFSFSGGSPKLVRLDVRSLKDDVILLVDDFFQVVNWRGETICEWFDRGYQDQPEYTNFKELLEAPNSEARKLTDERFPTPYYRVHFGSNWKKAYLPVQPCTRQVARLFPKLPSDGEDLAEGSTKEDLTEEDYIRRVAALAHRS